MSKIKEALEIANQEVGSEELPINQIKYNDWYYHKSVNGGDYPCAQLSYRGF